jgi:protease I
MELQGKRAAILIEQQYQEMEVWYPYFRLKEAGATVIVVGPEAGKTYPSKLGYPAKSEKAAKEVTASDLHGIVIPGGFAPDYFRRDPATVQLVKDVFARGKVVAAICHGPWLLCSTPALKGKRVTCFFSVKDDVTNAGGKYVDEETVVDGNVITARKPDDLPAFTTAVIRALRG